MRTENAVRIRGVGASPGVAHGPWVRFERTAAVSRGLVADPEAEAARLVAAAEVVERGCHSVLVSLGPDGAVLVDARTASHAEASVDDVANTVGAGDALLAGFLAAGGGQEALGNAVAWSVAAIRSPGTRMRAVTTADRGAVVVHERVDASRRLRS